MNPAMSYTYTAYTYDGIKECGYVVSSSGKYKSYGNTPKTYSAEKGIPEVLYTLEGEAAIYKAWKSAFDRLQPREQQIINAAYPQLLEKSKGRRFQAPSKIYAFALARIKNAGFMQKCERCGGSGAFSYNQRDGKKCFRCGGSGYALPNLTEKFFKEVREYFLKPRNCCSCAYDGGCSLCENCIDGKHWRESEAESAQVQIAELPEVGA